MSADVKRNLVKKRILKKILQSTVAAAAVAAAVSPANGKSRVELLPMITVTQEYDDNIFLDKTDTESDYITTVSPQIGLSVSSELNSFQITYAPTLVYYNNRSEEDTIRHRSTLDLGQNIGKFVRLNLTDTYYRTEDPFEADRETQTVRRNRNLYERNDANLSLVYRFGTGDSLSMGYRHSILENEDPTIDDALQQVISAGLSHRLSSGNNFGINFQYTKSEFNRDDGTAPGDNFTGYTISPSYSLRFDPRTTASINYSLAVRDFEGASEDYRTHNSGIGLSHSFSQSTSFSGNIGYFIQDRENSDNTTGLTFSANLSKSIERGSFSIGASTGQTEEFLEAKRRGFTRFQSLNSRFSYRISENLNSSAGVTYRQNSDAAGNEDETHQANAGVTTSFLRWFNAGLDYTYRKHVSDDPDDDYVDNRFVLRVSASRPIRSGLQ